MTSRKSIMVIFQSNTRSLPMNIRLVGAALLLISTLSLSPIAEAQTGGCRRPFVFWSSYESCDLQFGETPKFAVSTQNVTFFARASHLR